MNKPTMPAKSAVDEANDCLLDTFEPAKEIAVEALATPAAERPAVVRAPAAMDRKHASH